MVGLEDWKLKNIDNSRKIKTLGWCIAFPFGFLHSTFYVLYRVKKQTKKLMPLEKKYATQYRKEEIQSFGSTAKSTWSIL